MDLGATICTPRSPACGICPWRDPCAARRAGTAPDLPRKTPKKPKPTRRGIAYIGRRADGALLLERRPDKGLLGGMLGWPGSDWTDAPAPAPPCTADWRGLPGEVRHTFTHFHLILTIMVAELPMDCAPDRGGFIDRHDFRPSTLPTAMRKAFDLWKGSQR
jgi:A/G-specific adenine glycosylase